MGYEVKFYLRRVETTIVTLEYWKSTAGKPEYIQKDGVKITQVTVSTDKKVLSDFQNVGDETKIVWDELARRETQCNSE